MIVFLIHLNLWKEFQNQLRWEPVWCGSAGYLSAAPGCVSEPPHDCAQRSLGRSPEQPHGSDFPPGPTGAQTPWPSAPRSPAAIWHKTQSFNCQGDNGQTGAGLSLKLNFDPSDDKIRGAKRRSWQVIAAASPPHESWTKDAQIFSDLGELLAFDWVEQTNKQANLTQSFCSFFKIYLQIETLRKRLMLISKHSYIILNLSGKSNCWLDKTFLVYQ